MARIKGLEGLFSANQKGFKSKEDCVVAALHCILINSDLLCVGLGDAFSDKDSDTVTELLPEKWNENQEVYSLRYRCKDIKHCYLLKIVTVGHKLHVNLVLDEDDCSGITINADDFVSDDYGQFSTAFKQLDQLNDTIKGVIMGKEKSVKDKKKSPKKEGEKKKKQKSASPIPSIVPIPTAVPDSRPRGGQHDFPQIGGNDLDPFGRSQGTMHFDPAAQRVPSRSPYGGGGIGPFGGSGMGPFGGSNIGPFGGSGVGPFGGECCYGPFARGGDLPPHAVPLGARFDPIRPNISGNRFNPDPDHFRPPDYDDMFM